MRKTNDGGQAFPRTWTAGSNGEYWPDSESGMSLRDWFAGQALTGLIHKDVEADPRRIAKGAYIIADAMLAERQKERS